MSGPDEVPKPWADSVLKKARKVRSHDIAFVEGAASLILLGGLVAIDKFCEQKNKHKPRESWEKHLAEAAPASSIAPRTR